MTTAYDPHADWAREDKNERMARTALRAEVRLSWDGLDPWGSTIAAMGGACDVLAHVGRPDLIPDRLEYRPAAGGPDVKEYPSSHFLELLEADATTTDALAYWVRVLDRFADIVPEDCSY